MIIKDEKVNINKLYIAKTLQDTNVHGNYYSHGFAKCKEPYERYFLVYNNSFTQGISGSFHEFFSDAKMEVDRKAVREKLNKLTVENCYSPVIIALRPLNDVLSAKLAHPTREELFKFINDYNITCLVDSRISKERLSSR